MKILKFGGTSVGSPARMKEVCKLITDGEQKVVVLSAMSGTTNSLVEIADYIKKGNPEAANNVVNKLRRLYSAHLVELFSTGKMLDETRKLVNGIFMHIHDLAMGAYTESVEKEILAQGELISTNMVTNYLKECGIKVYLIPALDFMRTDANAEPDLPFIKQALNDILTEHAGYDIYITQGFICRNHLGEIDNLQRGGSLRLR